VAAGTIVFYFNLCMALTQLLALPFYQVKFLLMFRKDSSADYILIKPVKKWRMKAMSSACLCPKTQKSNPLKKVKMKPLAYQATN
jgi:hypothetical protein